MVSVVSRESKSPRDVFDGRILIATLCSDNHQRVCFSLALWNGKDKILKERLFGLTGQQGMSPNFSLSRTDLDQYIAGNHGEDVKEIYYYLDSTPTHSYMKFLYKYPQMAYPYEQLIEENAQRSREVPEFELMDTEAFDEDRYWDIFVEVGRSLSFSRREVFNVCPLS
jgi:predicted transcriptional regulator YdeE